MKSKKKNLFTILTPVLNGEKFITKTIESIKNQSYKNFEHIIIDGGSKDNTLKIIKNLKHKRLRLIILENKNMWDALNKGINESKGNIIGILNSDDYYYKNGIEIINDYFIKYNFDYIFGAVRKNKRILYRLEKDKVKNKFNIYPSHSASFFTQKKVHKKIGLYNSNLKFCSDYDLFYKIFTNQSLKGGNTKKNQVVGFFRSGGMSEKINFLIKLLIEAKIRFINKQNFISVLIIFFKDLISNIIHKVFKNNIFFIKFKKMKLKNKILLNKKLNT